MSTDSPHGAGVGVTSQIGEGHPRPLVVDKLAVTIVHDAYLSVRGLSGYSGCSIRWLRDRLIDSSHPLPHFKFPGGRILIRKSEFDDWLAKYRRVVKASLPTDGAKTPAS